jgi:hypothetical protein
VDGGKFSKSTWLLHTSVSAVQSAVHSVLI